jgi:hypothetical protein
VYSKLWPINEAVSKHPHQTVPNTHNRGSKQIDFVLATPVISRFILVIGLLDDDAFFASDHRAFFFHIGADRIFGTSVEALAAQQFWKLELEDPRIGQEYRIFLHDQFTHHNVYKRTKILYTRSESPEWSITDEGKNESMDRDVTRAMHHAESQCLLRKKHDETWSPPIGRDTHAVRYWDLRIKLLGIRDPANELLNYYASKSDVELSEFDHDYPINVCIHQINNARSKLKDVIKQATQLRSEFEVDLATSVIEHKYEWFRNGEECDVWDKYQLIEKELKSWESRRTTKKSWRKLGRQIGGHIKPNSLNRSKLTSGEVPGITPGS